MNNYSMKKNPPPVAIKTIRLGLLVTLALALSSVTLAQTVQVLPGRLWPDVSGKHINAHCGHILKAGKYFYWYGENRLGNREQVTCYVSADLKTWAFRNIVLKALGSESGFTERPKVIYNAKTKKYVMWMHKEGGLNDYGEARAAVAVSDTPDGDFTYLGSFRPAGNMSRDDYLFKDDDGKAYFISASSDNADLKLYLLTDDYLKVDHEITTLFKGQYREAPVIFKRSGTYYLLTSFCTGAKPNQQYYSTAASMNGPWRANRKLTSDRTWNTYYSQGAYAFAVTGTKGTTYVYALDRWVKPMRHVWLPLRFEKNGDIAPLEWYDKWTLDTGTGLAQTPAAPRASAENLARGKKVSATYDDPGEMFDFGHMANHRPELAVDGDRKTSWLANDNLPHWLEVDLSRQETLDRISLSFWKPGLHQFQVEISDDQHHWQRALDAKLGQAADSASLNLSGRKARYVRIWHLGSERGYNWTGFSEVKIFSGNLNIARGKSASSDDFQHPTVAANVADGNLASAWVIGNEQLPQSVSIDLERNVRIGGVRILWEAAGVAHRYKIESSPDGQRWDLLTDQSDNEKPDSQPYHKAANPVCRYVRLTLTGFDQMGIPTPRVNMRPWPGIREIEVFPASR